MIYDCEHTKVPVTTTAYGRQHVILLNVKGMCRNLYQAVPIFKTVIRLYLI